MSDDEREARVQQLSREASALYTLADAKLREARALQTPAPPDVQTSEQK